MTVAITRLAMSAAELRSVAAQTRDAKAARRMLAIGSVLEGWSREAAAEACAMDRQTLRDWVHRYNALGPEGLFALPRRNGPLPRLTAEQQAKVVEWVEQGPNLERDGVVRWRCVDLQRRIAQAFAVQLHARWANCCASCRSGACRCVRSTRRANPRNRRFSAQLCRSRDRRLAAGSGWQAGGDLVHRRGTCWPAGHADPRVGETRLTPPRPARSTL